MTALELNKFPPKKTRKTAFRKNILKNEEKNIFEIQAYDSIMCGYFLLDILILWLRVNVEQILHFFLHLNNFKSNIVILSGMQHRLNRSIE